MLLESVALSKTSPQNNRKRCKQSYNTVSYDRSECASLCQYRYATLPDLPLP